MGVLKDFQCKRCPAFEATVGVDTTSISCPWCEEPAERVFLSAPAVLGETKYNWNEHYDLQLGQHFSSAAEKSAFLKKTGRLQWNGQSNPRKDTNTSIRCTRAQADKEFGIVKRPGKLPRCTNEELK
jgi:hypothetical protein